MKRVARILLVGLFTAVIVGGAAALWYTRPQHDRVLTDADTIRAPAGTAQGRDILWQPPEPVPMGTSIASVSGASISPDGGTLYFARRSERGDMDIFACTRSGAAWSTPRPLAVNSEADELDPAPGADGTLYFASNRAGGRGGMDLWATTDGRHAAHLDAVNSPWHETGPTVDPSGTGDLYFSSNRPRAGTATAGEEAWASELQDELAGNDHDLYRAPRVATGFDAPVALDHLNTQADERAPALSAAGDFIYFASDRPGGHGGSDLYRAWTRDGATPAPRNLGPEVNSSGRESDPALALDGFRLLFTTDRASADTPALFQTTSREVFTLTRTFRARIDWLALLPWIAWGLLLGLLAGLLWALLRTLRSEGFSKLGLMARCLLGSALLHMLVLLLLTFWNVGSSIADWARDGQGRRVAIVSPSVGSGLAEQVRGALTELAISFEAEDSTQQDMIAPSPLLLTASALIPVERAAVPDAAESLVEADSADTTDAHTEPTELAAAAPPSVAQADPAAVDTPSAPTRSRAAETRALTTAQRATAARRDAPTLPVAVEATVALDTASAPVVAPSTTFVDRVEANETSAETALAAAAPETMTPSDAAVTTDVAAVPEAPSERVAEAERFVLADPGATQPTERAESSGVVTGTAEAQAASDFAPVEVNAERPMRALTTLETPSDMPAASAPELASEVTPPTVDVDDAIRTDLALAALPAGTVATSAERSATVHASDAPVSERAESTLADSNPARPAGAMVAMETQSTSVAADAPLLDFDFEPDASEAVPTDLPALPPTALVLDDPEVRESSFALPATRDESTTNADEHPVLVAVAPTSMTSERASDPADAWLETTPPERTATTAPEPNVATEARRTSLAAGPSAHEASAPDSAMSLPEAIVTVDATNTPLLPTLEENSAFANAYALEEDAPEVTASDPAQTQPRSSPMLAPSTAVAATVELDIDPAVAGPTESVAFVDMTATEAEESPPTDLPAFVLATAVDPDEITAIDLHVDLPRDLDAPPNPYKQRAAEERRELVERMGGSEETERAVGMALDWLARHQSMDGRWDSDGFDFECGDCNSAARVDVDIALTGLAVLCFLATDNTHVKPGPYQENIAGAIEFLLERQRPSGDLIGRETMYSHGIASIALAEAYGMTGDARLKEPVERAIAFIIEARNQRIGGWRYAPGQVGDTSVLGWQVMAMKSASRAGITVPDIGFESARRWLHLVAAPTHRGRYAYQPNHSPTPAMTAESMFVSQLLGAMPHEVQQQGSADWIIEHLPEWGEDANTYYWYYGTLALFQHQGDPWDAWNERVKDELLSAQHLDGALAGSWDPSDQWSRVGGRVYQTAICTLTLEVYYRYLPLYVQ